MGANLLTLIMALWQNWVLADLLVVYWFQSVVIGGSYVLRMLNLDKFSTANLKINGRSVDPTPATKRQVAGFFCLHFGAFHLVYMGFIFSGEVGGSPHINLSMLLACLIFLANHSFSYRYFRDQDRTGTPNIGTMMFTPYLRIVPMHLTIIIGAAMGGGGLVLFILLKTVSDVLMHWVEHRILQRKAT